MSVARPHVMPCSCVRVRFATCVQVLLAGTALLWATSLAAQMPPDETGEPAPDETLAGAVNPDATQPPANFLDDAAILVDTTLRLYELVSEHEGDCPSLGLALGRYLDHEEASLSDAIARLTAAGATLTDADKAALAAFIHERMGASPVLRLGQDGLYACLHSDAIQGERQWVEKAMDRFFAMHQALLLAIVGNVD